MTAPHVTFISQGRLVERNGVVVAAEIDGKPVLCHFLRETLTSLQPRASHANSVDLFRDCREALIPHLAAKAARVSPSGEFLHLLPSDITGDKPWSSLNG